jgi:hypothetical protein
VGDGLGLGVSVGDGPAVRLGVGVGTGRGVRVGLGVGTGLGDGVGLGLRTVGVIGGAARSSCDLGAGGETASEQAIRHATRPSAAIVNQGRVIGFNFSLAR